MRVLCLNFLVLICGFLYSQVSIAESVVYKKLCAPANFPSACAEITGFPSLFQTVSYEFEISNPDNTALASNYLENFPSGFTPTGTPPLICIDENGFALQVTYPSYSSGLPPSPLEFSFGSQIFTTATCRFDGYFTQALVTLENHVLPVAGALGNGTHAVAIPSNQTLGTDLAISKNLVSTSPIDISSGTGIAQYRIEISNTNDVAIGSWLKIRDKMSAIAGSDSYTISGPNNITCNALDSSLTAFQTGACFAATAPISSNSNSSWQQIALFEAVPLILPAGGKIVLTYDLNISMINNATCKPQTNMGIQNHVIMDMNNNSTTIYDTNTSNNNTLASLATTPVITGLTYNPLDPACTVIVQPPQLTPVLNIEKTLVGVGSPPLAWDSSPQPWGTAFTYDITVTNPTVLPDGSVNMYNFEGLILSDSIAKRYQTPGFDAQIQSIQFSLCPSNSTCVVTAPTPTPSPSVSYPAGASNTLLVASGTIDKLRPGDSVRLKIVATFDQPTCDAVPLRTDKVIENIGRIQGTLIHTTDTSIPPRGQAWADSTIVLMEPPINCNFTVTKILRNTPAEVVFGVPIVYDINITSGSSVTESFGTLMDFLRIDQLNYASSLNFSSSYECYDSTLGSGSSQTGNNLVSGFSPSGNHPTQSVQYVSQPTLGTLIFASQGPVIFPPGSSLSCVVEIIINEPDPLDPYCYGNNIIPNIQNTIALDRAPVSKSVWSYRDLTQSSIINQTWDTSTATLPRCYAITVEKSLVTTPVSPQGPAVQYRINISNSGSAPYGDLVFDPSTNDGLVFTDTVTTGALSNVSANSNPLCNPNGQHPCDWLSSMSSSGGEFVVSKLLSGDTVSLNYIDNPPFSQHDRVCNSISGSVMENGTISDRWYSKYNRLDDQVCFDVLGRISVYKKFDGIRDVDLTDALAANYVVEINCTDQAGGDYNSTLVLNQINNFSASELNIPLASTCTVSELPFWRQGLPENCHWLEPMYETEQLEGSTTPPTLFLDLNNGSAEVYIHNRYECYDCDPVIPKEPEIGIGKVLLSEHCDLNPGLSNWIQGVSHACEFGIQLFNTGTADFNGFQSFTEHWIDNAAVIPPLPPGWNCTPQYPGSNANGDVTCTSIAPITIPVGGMLTVPVHLYGESNTYPSINCVSLDNGDSSAVEDCPQACITVPAPAAEAKFTKECKTQWINGEDVAIKCNIVVGPLTPQINGVVELVDYWQHLNTGSSPPAGQISISGNPPWTCPSPWANPTFCHVNGQDLSSYGQTSYFDLETVISHDQIEGKTLENCIELRANGETIIGPKCVPIDIGHSGNPFSGVATEKY